MSELTIRQATDDDGQAIRDINLQAWSGCCNSELLEQRYGIIDGVGWAEHLARSVAESMKRKATTTFVAEKGGKVIGYAEAMMSRDKPTEVGVIGHNAVDVDHRRRGVGTALMKHVVDYLTQRGARVLKVITQVSDKPACRIYERLGFKEFTRMVYYSKEA